MTKYNPQKIEKKWQNFWEKRGLYRAKDFSKKPKKYILIEFPYPSGEGLHVGHGRSYSALDAVARKERMAGFNILFPIGWDAFGLPSENYAIKTGIHPSISTQKNIENYKKQLKNFGFSFDWSREINTTDPKYYKWTQWIFLKLFEKGLAYQAEIPINWCPACKIGLANEEVVEGACERCGASVGKKVLKQWMIKITKYADRLIEDLKKVDYPKEVKSQQINWIGRSYGAEIDFKVEDSKDIIKVFTTRADTIFGVTAIVLAPEHFLVNKLIKEEHRKEVEKYIVEAQSKSDFEREKLEKRKTGIFTGSYCLNPINNEKVPIWIGDYIIATYGGGAVMVVPAHDERDYDFAKKYGLKIRKVISNDILINSAEFSGFFSKEAIERITQWLEKKGKGRKIIQYKLRDWIFSRQHYWGEPIPIIHCQKCGPVVISEKNLPVKLPHIKEYQPTGTGESPLVIIQKWVNVKCPKCKGSAKRETDTMPNWAGSNWYYLAYLMRGISNFQPPISKYKKVFKYWMPVDWYNGGFEHTTLHLLYSRFIYKFLHDIGLVPELEPYKRRTSHGVILAEDNRKMSKSLGNIVNPDNIIKEFGADALRLYEMFIGPFDQTVVWNTRGIKGCYRFLEKVWKLQSKANYKLRTMNYELEKLLHKTIKKITEDIENYRFNTAISALMILINELDKQKEISIKFYSKFLILLAPFAPHICEELWQKLGNKKSIFLEKWPKYNPELIKEEKILLIIQINSKIKDKIEAEINISKEEAEKLALSQEKIKKLIAGKKIKKIIFVSRKLINIVIE
jgi:leucyl-tRNA synthetase